MFKLAVAVLALAAVGIQGRPHSDAVGFDCTGKPDGFYADLADPKAFISCVAEAAVKRVVCMDGFKFDGVDSCVADVEEEAEVTGEVEKKERQTIPQVFTDNNEEYIPDDDDDEFGSSQRKNIYNVEFTKNIFPRSVVIIGKMNREQKNK